MRGFTKLRGFTKHQSFQFQEIFFALARLQNELEDSEALELVNQLSFDILEIAMTRDDIPLKTIHKMWIAKVNGTPTKVIAYEHGVPIREVRRILRRGFSANEFTENLVTGELKQGELLG